MNNDYATKAQSPTFGTVAENLVSNSNPTFVNKKLYTGQDKKYNKKPNHDQVEFAPRRDKAAQVEGVLEVMPDAFGFIRSNQYLSGQNDIYVSPSIIKGYQLRTGDMLTGGLTAKSANEKFSALEHLKSVNQLPAYLSSKRPRFENLTPIYPNNAINLETQIEDTSLRMIRLLSPIGKGQRGLIVSPPKAGKTTLIKKIASAIKENYSDLHLFILLIDERPEEVTDMTDTLKGENIEIVSSTFDELPERHRKVSEMVLERAKRLVELKKDVVILLDGITRLTRAYNLSVSPSGRTLSGGLDPSALHMAKKFFGAARNMREGGSLTILATALIETGSRMDDVIFEEFKGTGNMELVLSRKLAEKRIFPAVSSTKSGTRRDDLLLDETEIEILRYMRSIAGQMRSNDADVKMIDYFLHTSCNRELIKFLPAIDVP